MHESQKESLKENRIKSQRHYQNRGEMLEDIFKRLLEIKIKKNNWMNEMPKEILGRNPRDIFKEILRGISKAIPSENNERISSEISERFPEELPREISKRIVGVIFQKSREESR